MHSGLARRHPVDLLARGQLQRPVPGDLPGLGRGIGSRKNMMASDAEFEAALSGPSAIPLASAIERYPGASLSTQCLHFQKYFNNESGPRQTDQHC